MVNLQTSFIEISNSVRLYCDAGPADWQWDEEDAPTTLALRLEIEVAQGELTRVAEQQRKLQEYHDSVECDIRYFEATLRQRRREECGADEREIWAKALTEALFGPRDFR